MLHYPPPPPHEGWTDFFVDSSIFFSLSLLLTFGSRPILWVAFTRCANFNPEGFLLPLSLTCNSSEGPTGLTFNYVQNSGASHRLHGGHLVGSSALDACRSRPHISLLLPLPPSNCVQHSKQSEPAKTKSDLCAPLSPSPHSFFTQSEVLTVALESPWSAPLVSSPLFYLSLLRSAPDIEPPAFPWTRQVSPTSPTLGSLLWQSPPPQTSAWITPSSRGLRLHLCHEATCTLI